MYEMAFDQLSLWAYLFCCKNVFFRRMVHLGGACAIILFLHNTFFT